MADISKIQINSQIYNLKDNYVREQLKLLLGDDWENKSKEDTTTENE